MALAVCRLVQTHLQFSAAGITNEPYARRAVLHVEAGTGQPRWFFFDVHELGNGVGRLDVIVDSP